MVQCPECKTTYMPSTLGLTLQHDQPVSCTVQCAVCRSTFDATVTPEAVTPGWFGRNVMRRQPTLTHVSRTLLRERR